MRGAGAWLGIYLEGCSINAGNFLAKSKLPVVCGRMRPNARVLADKTEKVSVAGQGKMLPVARESFRPLLRLK